MITKYGYGSVSRLAFFCVLVASMSLVFINAEGLKIAIVLVATIFFLLVLYFFRDPNRVPPAGESFILSPADGKVVMVGNVRDDEFLKSDATQISIFLSPLNVHVNRIPISGKVKYVNYVKGGYLVAYHEKASEKNERTVIGIENGKFKILMRQIAGFVARRIVCELRPEDSVRAGERFGMIKFGSRVDVLVPVHSELKVRLSDHVVAGETVLAVVRI